MIEEAYARTTDPETSHAAAVSVQRIRESQKHILNIFKMHGSMTDEILVGIVKSMSPSGARTRRKELTDRGILKDSGYRAVLKSGRKAIVWEIA